MQTRIPKPDPLIKKDISKDALSLGFLGGGQMGCALCCSILRSNILVPGSSITVTDKHQSCLDTINQKTKPILSTLNSPSSTNNNVNNINNVHENNGSSNDNLDNGDKELNSIEMKTTLNNKDVIDSDIVILAIKPQNTKTVLSELREHWTGTVK